MTPTTLELGPRERQVLIAALTDYRDLLAVAYLDAIGEHDEFLTDSVTTKDITAAALLTQLERTETGNGAD